MIVAGNWKMHGDKSFAQSLLQALAAASQDLQPVELLVFPPAIWLPLAQAYLKDTAVAWVHKMCILNHKGRLRVKSALQCYKVCRQHLSW